MVAIVAFLCPLTAPVVGGQRNRDRECDGKEKSSSTVGVSKAVNPKDNKVMGKISGDQKNFRGKKRTPNETDFLAALTPRVAVSDFFRRSRMDEWLQSPHH
uniref:Secreted protein n=1 Tax=Oryza barthii TaxID=65489 RepID=A0A1V1H8W0_9ORYZ|nr:hypothetical protein [Oryza barthii]